MKITKNVCEKTDLPYITYIPDNVSDHPAMILQLHGAGERGCGGEELDKVLVHGFANVVNDENLKDCSLVMPQCPTDSFWVAKIESLKVFIDNLVSAYHVDANRIYLCGLSMGGYGTWYTATAYPDLFAAIAPCCGGGMAWLARTLTMPIWTFHGMKDTAVSPNQTLEMIARLEGYHPNFKYTLYENVGHDSWTRAFSQELLEWMLAQHK